MNRPLKDNSSKGGAGRLVEMVSDRG
jgi:hypothetical protein